MNSYGILKEEKSIAVTFQLTVKNWREFHA